MISLQKHKTFQKSPSLHPMARPKQMWSAEFIARARALWDAGKSTLQIGCELGVSKNVIVGIAHRNHFPARPSPIKRRPL